MSIFNYFSSEKATQQALEIIKSKCAEAGWRIKNTTENGIVLGFNTEVGIENIFIQLCGTNKKNEKIIEISAEGVLLPNDLTIAALMSLELMERNGNLLMGHWGIETINNKKYFTVMHSAVAKTLDVEELEAAVIGCLDEKVRFLKAARK